MIATRRKSPLTDEIDTSFRVSVYAVVRALIHGESFEQATGVSDELTGLLNERACRKTWRTLSPGHCVLLVDVDDFGQYNERNGRRSGDDVLREIGSTLRSLRRRGTVGYRLCGDLFAVICLDMSQAISATRALRRIASIMGGVTVSQGLFRVKERCGLNQALERATMALREAKAAGKDSVSIYGAQMHVYTSFLSTGVSHA